MANLLLSATRPLSLDQIDELEPDLGTFLRISAPLTGFSEDDLLETGMTEIYYFTLMKEQDHELVRSFFEKARELLNGRTPIEEAIRRHFIPIPKDEKHLPAFKDLPFEGLAQRIILLWYKGSWTTMNGKDHIENDRDRTSAVSAEAYKQGLIWVVAKTHPAGAKQPGYGSWSKPPIEPQTPAKL